MKTFPRIVVRLFSVRSLLSSSSSAMIAKRARADAVDSVVQVPVPAESRRSSARIRARREAHAVVIEQHVANGDELSQTEIVDVEIEEEIQLSVKKRKRRKNDEPVVYDIPPVESLTTSFKGILCCRLLVPLSL